MVTVFLFFYPLLVGIVVTKLDQSRPKSNTDTTPVRLNIRIDECTNKSFTYRLDVGSSATMLATGGSVETCPS